MKPTTPDGRQGGSIGRCARSFPQPVHRALDDRQHLGQVLPQYADQDAQLELARNVQHDGQQLADFRVRHVPTFPRRTGHEQAACVGGDRLQVPADALRVDLAVGPEVRQRGTPQTRYSP